MSSPISSLSSSRPAAAWRHLKSLWPSALPIDGRERWRALLGGGLGVLLTALISRYAAGPAVHGLWLVAPIGASAVLVFAVPTSPMAQPWAVVGGNTLSALVGVLCAWLVPDPVLAAGLAVALAIGLMFQLRCLHPPGGAAALLCALGGAGDAGLRFVVFPVLTNCLLLVVAGVAFHRLMGRRYPQGVAGVATPSAPGDGQLERLTRADLDQALAQFNQVLDVNRDDLQALLQHAQAASYQRRFGDLRCADIMSTQVLSVQFGTALDEAWALMRDRRVKALPVTDRAGRIAGIVTTADYLRHAQIHRHDGLGERLRALVQKSGLLHSDKPEVVGQIMTREVRVASLDRHVSTLVPLFSEDGHHHIPVIDTDRRLVGIITQSDVVRALYGAARAAG